MTIKPNCSNFGKMEVVYAAPKLYSLGRGRFGDWGSLGRERFGEVCCLGRFAKCGVVVGLALTLILTLSFVLASCKNRNVVLSTLPEYRTTAGGLLGNRFKSKDP